MWLSVRLQLTSIAYNYNGYELVFLQRVVVDTNDSTYQYQQEAIQNSSNSQTLVNFQSLKRLKGTSE